MMPTRRNRLQASGTRDRVSGFWYWVLASFSAVGGQRSEDRFRGHGVLFWTEVKAERGKYNEPLTTDN